MSQTEQRIKDLVRTAAESMGEATALMRRAPDIHSMWGCWKALHDAADPHISENWKARYGPPYRIDMFMRDTWPMPSFSQATEIVLTCGVTLKLENRNDIGGGVLSAHCQPGWFPDCRLVDQIRGRGAEPTTCLYVRRYFSYSDTHVLTAPIRREGDKISASGELLTWEDFNEKCLALEM